MRHEIKRTAVVVALAAAIGIGSAVPASGQRADPAELLSQGQRAFDAGDYEAARRDLWAYLEATASLSGPSRLPQAEALYTIALMEPDAAVAARHYQTIVGEYPASSVADDAVFRLAQLDLVEGRTAEAREKLQRLAVDYPFSRFQAEIPLWTGKAWLADRQYRRATDAFIEGFTRVKRQDLPQELSMGQREALGAEYVYQLARAFGEEGDQRTATQYYAMLSLDYPDSPQAAEARLALEGGAPAVEVAQAPIREDPIREEPVRDEPVREEPIRDAPVRDTPAAAEPAYVPDVAAPDVVIEDAPPRAERTPEPVREEPRVVIEDAGPRAAAPAESGTAWLQVGAFTSATNAADLSKRLKADGFDASVEIGIVDGQGYYRVRVGPYRMPPDASRLDETRRRLEARGYPARQVGE
ncbi:MAG TPA: SPOR domain-containing protein [Gemmatimonadota bacterium]|nr:SPOR domain-containing protein [Gemmatimonadota bacterium]